MAFYYNSMMGEVHVLLVDNDMRSLLETAKLLEFNSCKVTAIQLACVASAMLSEQNVNFDVVIVDINSSNSQGLIFKLLHDAVSMDITVILMSNNANDTQVKRAIENGAFLFIQKPATMDVVKYLWQHVLREKMQKINENGRFAEMAIEISKKCSLKIGVNLEERDKNIEDNNVHVNENIGSNSKAMVIYQKERIKGFEYGSDHDNIVDEGKMPRMCTEWTQELHDKFIGSVKELGEGRCFPRDILKLMNVPGLKRKQVASHLQRCRAGWKPPRERQKTSKSSISDPHHTKPRKYGSYPRIARGCLPPFLIKEKKNDQQSLVPTNYNMENSTPFPDVENSTKYYRTSNNVSNNVNENVDGNLVVESNQGDLQPFDINDSFGLSVDINGATEINLDLEEFDFNQLFSQSQIISNVMSEADEEVLKGFGFH